jgi:hypothetical protein
MLHVERDFETCGFSEVGFLAKADCLHSPWHSQGVAKTRTDGIIPPGVEAKHLSAGEWPSGKATDFESFPARELIMSPTTPRVASGIDWAFAPDWLTIEEACFLSGHDRGAMLEIIAEDGVDLDDDGLIDKRSLWEFQEALVEAPRWRSME